MCTIADPEGDDHPAHIAICGVGAVLLLTSVAVGAILCTLDQVGRGSESALAVIVSPSQARPLSQGCGGCSAVRQR
jgi:hypothetical protein